ncbi:NUDIX domain-containing protein [Candidatus Roizmanbacteria bacterium]|nr:NUDIX domain-containing protein [Candidatus Roizmanbacteria bacterium]
MTEKVRAAFVENGILQEVHQGDYITLPIFHRQTGRLLIIQRGDDHEDFGIARGDWDMVSETAKENENLLLLCRRAILEEVISKRHHLELFHYGGSLDPISWNNGHKIHRAMFRYVGPPDTSLFSPREPDEILNYKWVGFPDLLYLTARRKIAPFVLPFVMKF